VDMPILPLHDVIPDRDKNPEMHTLTTTETQSFAECEPIKNEPTTKLKELS